MESSGGDSGARRRRPEAYDRLELAVRRLLDRHEQLTRRLQASEAKTKELEATVRRLVTGALDPLELQGRVEQLDADNRGLTRRVEEARERVRRLLERFDFIEEEL